jgi:hypothetical protein
MDFRNRMALINHFMKTKTIYRGLVVMFWLVVIALLAFGCTDAYQAKLGGYGDKYSIELLGCDGTVLRSWVSSGKVSSEANSDGYFFMDSQTGKLIEVSGTLIITKQ